MTETDDYMTDDERQAWLTSARAYGAVFPEFADLVALIEARLLAVGAGNALPVLRIKLGRSDATRMAERCARR